MLRKIIYLLPDRVIRFFGRIQFRLPFLKSFINNVAQYAISGEGVIQRGEGKGLRFDATDCNPGYLAGTSSPDEQKLLVDVLGEGDVIYDIGAFAGFYAVIAARHVSPEGQVYAFEPIPEHADRIRYNAEINDLENLNVVKAAVCDKNGTVNFESQEFFGRNSIMEYDEGSNSITVSAITLDSWMKNHRPPDVIKMDIEGAEIDALRGATELIRKHRPIMLIEVHWKGQDFVDFVNGELKPLGYEATTYSGQPLPTQKAHRYHALLIPSETHDVNPHSVVSAEKIS